MSRSITPEAAEPVGKELRMARVVPDIREYVTLEQAGLSMKAAYEMGLKRGGMEVTPFCADPQNGGAIVGGEG